MKVGEVKVANIGESNLDEPQINEKINFESRMIHMFVDRTGPNKKWAIINPLYYKVHTIIWV